MASTDSHLLHLPTEILIEIVKLLPNFSSLWALINAFPRFDLLFLSLPFEILEHFLQKETPPMHPSLIRVALVTRLPPPWFPDIQDATKYMCRHKPLDLLFSALSRHIEEQPQLALKVAFLVRGLVKMAHKIHAVTHACLDYYVEKSMTIKPERWDATHNLEISLTATLFNPSHLVLRHMWKSKYSSDSSGAYKCLSIYELPISRTT
ncbi:hypothetical protein TCE0_017f04515 [Talaromyces pinophilus]|jgi:hypothetical protein|uniref:F-box domain-containing protein n=1 Tax=Talaromyces pinophilus TaxID=128442 RepID=A0A6V8H8P4_TALPI|nr:hypothetical protein TCE0_017f04515 [Talaromyces pinophilus]